MRKRISRILATGGAAALAAGLAVLPASAAVLLTSWTVSPGGSITLTGATATFTDATTLWELHCHSSSAKGSLEKGSDHPGTGLGSVTTLTFSTCTGPGKAAYTITATLPWSLNATAYNSTKGVTTMLIKAVHATFSATGCSGTLDGTSATSRDGVLEAHYTNSTGTLRVAPPGAALKLYGVTGCTGLFKAGDSFTLTTHFTVSPVQTITGTKITG